MISSLGGIALVTACVWLLALPSRCKLASPVATRARTTWWRGTRARLGEIRARRNTAMPLGALLIEVATRMRTGANARSAWRETLVEEPGSPADLDQLAARARVPSRQDAIAGARAAVQVADRLGAPVADVLECCAQGLSEAEEAASQRRTAFAAPRATARLLTWLPLAGLGLGILLGVDPIAVFTDGGAGTACFALGAVLTLAGRRWSHTLIRQAQRVGR